jgi:RimJ/RimL family protein N-acetyltransferase
MDKLPFRDLAEFAPEAALGPASVGRGAVAGHPSWRYALPVLIGSSVYLRELRTGDAPVLFAALSSAEVSRFISPPPTTLDGFRRFIAWTLHERARGHYLSFAITLPDSDTAVGLFQLRSLDHDFANAEWGFALAVEFWGSGMFMEGAHLMLEFAFETIGVRRLEARAALHNGRGTAALRKLGAVQEGVLRRGFRKHGEFVDQALWTIVDDEWRQAKAVWGPRVIH